MALRHLAANLTNPHRDSTLPGYMEMLTHILLTRFLTDLQCVASLAFEEHIALADLLGPYLHKKQIASFQRHETKFSVQEKCSWSSEQEFCSYILSTKKQESHAISITARLQFKPMSTKGKRNKTRVKVQNTPFTSGHSLGNSSQQTVGKPKWLQASDDWMPDALI